VGLEITPEQIVLEEELSKDASGEDIGRFGKVREYSNDCLSHEHADLWARSIVDGAMASR
jgi:hypothetical protein